MRSIREVGRFDVYSEKGRRIGRVGDVLFAPGAVRVVGFVVERPRLVMLFDRKDRYLALDRARFEDDDLIAFGKDGWDKAAAKRLGLSWDDSVIWSGMPVRTVAGKKLGAVRDALFDPETGELGGLGLTAGSAADLAVGVRDLPAKFVDGFDGEAVVVQDEAIEVKTDGGAAAAAGKGAAVAKVAAGETAKKAVAYTSAAAKAAANSSAGKKAFGLFKALKDEVVDAMGDPDDD